MYIDIIIHALYNVRYMKKKIASTKYTLQRVEEFGYDSIKESIMIGAGFMGRSD